MYNSNVIERFGFFEISRFFVILNNIDCILYIFGGLM